MGWITFLLCWWFMLHRRVYHRCSKDITVRKSALGPPPKKGMLAHLPPHSCAIEIVFVTFDTSGRPVSVATRERKAEEEWEEVLCLTMLTW